MPADPLLTLVLEGAAIRDIPGFYAEINRVFMAEEDWQLGESLDALDDMLRGGYGALAGHEAAQLIWRDFAVSAAALGPAATRAWLTGKLERPGFDPDRIRRDLAALAAGTGPTFISIVLEILADHPQIRLIQA